MTSYDKEGQIKEAESLDQFPEWEKRGRNKLDVSSYILLQVMLFGSMVVYVMSIFGHWNKCVMLILISVKIYRFQVYHQLMEKLRKSANDN